MRLRGDRAQCCDTIACRELTASVPLVVGLEREIAVVAHAGKVTQIKAHRQAKLSTENVFHTVLDLADIRYPGERLDWSIASATLSRHPRYVDSYGWTNYDKATPTGDCREMLTKGKKLTLPH